MPLRNSLSHSNGVFRFDENGRDVAAIGEFDVRDVSAEARGVALRREAALCAGRGEGGEEIA